MKVADFGGHIHLIGHHAVPWMRRFIRSTRETGTVHALLMGKKPKRSPPVITTCDIGSTAAGRRFAPAEATDVATTLIVFGIVIYSLPVAPALNLSFRSIEGLWVRGDRRSP